MTLFDVSGYMPHGLCLLWEPWLVALWVGSDLLIAGSYFAIPVALLMFVRRRPELRYRGLVALFASFILLCGLTHVLSIVTLWIPVYPLTGAAKLATGIVSTATAIVLFRLIPVLTRIPSPTDLAEANDRLRTEIAAHEGTLADLRVIQADLEERVAARTAELAEANERLSVAMRETVHRNSNLLSIVVSIARQSARGVERVDEYVAAFIGRIDALARATASVLRTERGHSVDLGEIAQRQLEPLTLTYGDRLKIAGPPIRIGAEAAQQISLALHELGTNAQKYGGLAGEAGTVALRWAVEPGAASRLVLDWTETGLGEMPVEADRSGFGTRLLTKILPSMLNGEAERSFEPGRMTYRLDAPLSGVAPRERTVSADDEAAAGALPDPA